MSIGPKRKTKPQVLLIEEDRNFVSAIEGFIKSLGYEVLVEQEPMKAQKLINQGTIHPKAILSDSYLGGNDIPCIVISDDHNANMRMVQEGAIGYVEKKGVIAACHHHGYLKADKLPESYELADDPEEETVAREAMQKLMGLIQKALNPPVAVVVDDFDWSRDMLAEHLTKRGWRAVTFSRYEEVGEWLDEHHEDVQLLFADHEILPDDQKAPEPLQGMNFLRQRLTKPAKFASGWRFQVVPISDQDTTSQEMLEIMGKQGDTFFNKSALRSALTKGENLVMAKRLDGLLERKEANLRPKEQIAIG